MKTATINEIKKELLALSPAKTRELCLHLAKFKKENKELLTYLLFESDNEINYINSIKEEVDGLFELVNRISIYHATKSIRKILRNINKYTRFSGSRQTEAELLIYFCRKLKNSGIAIRSSIALSNLYLRQIEKINKAVSTLHEDLQHDYEEELEEINDPY